MSRLLAILLNMCKSLCAYYFTSPSSKMLFWQITRKLQKERILILTWIHSWPHPATCNFDNPRMSILNTCKNLAMMCGLCVIRAKSLSVLLWSSSLGSRLRIVMQKLHNISSNQLDLSGGQPNATMPKCQHCNTSAGCCKHAEKHVCFTQGVRDAGWEACVANRHCIWASGRDKVSAELCSGMGRVARGHEGGIPR